jgi:hypothetical protein
MCSFWNMPKNGMYPLWLDVIVLECANKTHTFLLISMIQE